MRLKKKKKKKNTRAASGLSSFQAEAASSSVLCITAEVTLTQRDSSRLLCLSVSASVSVEVSLHQLLEVSLGRREEGVTLTKSPIMGPVGADRALPRRQPAGAKLKTELPGEKRTLQMKHFHSGSSTYFSLPHRHLLL